MSGGSATVMVEETGSAEGGAVVDCLEPRRFVAALMGVWSAVLTSRFVAVQL